jgi:two-component system NarL family response regulator
MEDSHQSRRAIEPDLAAGMAAEIAAASKGRETDKQKVATLVLAVPLAKSRQGWLRDLADDFAVCEVAERRGLQQVVANLKPEVLVVDLELPGFGGSRGLREIRRLSPHTRIIAVSASPSNEEGIFALKIGCSGYSARSVGPAELVKAVKAVQRDEIWAPRGMVRRLVAELVSLVDSQNPTFDDSKLDTKLCQLTERQRIVASMISRGASNKEIGNRMNISERTVKAHLTQVFRTLGVSDRLHLAALFRGQWRL